MSGNMRIVAHILVKNEEKWIWYSLMSVLDYVDEILVWDAGSTDRTVEIIKTISKNSEGIIKKINKKYSLREFLDDSKENPKILLEFFTEEEAEKLGKIISSKKGKDKEIKKEFSMTCVSPNGLEIIKNILGKYEGIKYLGNSNYVITKKSPDLKKADQEIREITKIIEESAEKSKCTFVLKNK